MNTTKKTILLSIHPMYCNLIAEGKKTIEVRKTRPNLQPPFKVYMYCTCPNTGSTEDRFYIYLPPHDTPKQVNGTIVGEFVCDAIKVFGYDEHIGYPTPAYEGDPSFYDCGAGYWITCGELEATGLSEEEFDTYGNKQTLYGWHISNVVIYSKPKGLRRFTHACPKNVRSCMDCKHTEDGWECKSITRPPRSWCYVEELNDI